MNWLDIDYLRLGDGMQREVYEVLRRHALLETLKPYDPVLVGTVPIGIPIATSDLDIICEVRDYKAFEAFVAEHYRAYPNFSVSLKEVDGLTRIKIAFDVDGWPIEIFGQSVPTAEQNGFKHMIVEARLLALHGDAFRRTIIALKEEGLKTEPAFARALGLDGDPYLSLLEMYDRETTFLYLARHAESVYTEGAEATRGLRERGERDALALSSLLRDEGNDIYYSSPYKRTIRTIQQAAEDKPIHLVDDLRERAIGDFGSLSFREAKHRVFEDFSFAFPNGESSFEAQARAVPAIERMLTENKGSKIAIGTHGDIMTLILNHYDPAFGYEFWERTTMPDLYKLRFGGARLESVDRLWANELGELK